jgi:hypothetical protein
MEANRPRPDCDITCRSVQRGSGTEAGAQLDLTAYHGPLDSGGGRCDGLLGPDSTPRAWTNAG